MRAGLIGDCMPVNVSGAVCSGDVISGVIIRDRVIYREAHLSTHRVIDCVVSRDFE